MLAYCAVFMSISDWPRLRKCLILGKELDQWAKQGDSSLYTTI